MAKAQSDKVDKDITLLHLYISGATPCSLRAVVNAKQILEQYLPGRYDLKVVDISKEPKRAREDAIVAAPTLIKRTPPPRRQIIGDLSDTQRVLKELGIFTG